MGNEIVVDGELNLNNQFEGEMEAKVVLEFSGYQVKTKAEWKDDAAYIPYEGELIVYADAFRHNGRNVPGIKVGDGVTPVGSLLFTTEDIRAKLLEIDGLYEDIQATLIQHGERIDALETAALGFVDDAYVKDGVAYFTHDGEVLFEVSGIGGGSGGGSGNQAVLTVTNAQDWLSKTISAGNPAEVAVNWSSLEKEIPTGNGTLTIRVNNIVKSVQDVQQGLVTAEVSKYLGAGVNKVRVSISDAYNNTASVIYTISVVNLSLSSQFDSSAAFTAGEAIEYTYTPVGAAEKTVHFVVDGTDTGTDVVTVSGRQVSHVLAGMAHGSHSLLVYFTAEIDGSEVKSNELYYDLVVINKSSVVPVIASPFRATSARQYETLSIPYTVYNPQGLTAAVDLYVNDELLRTLTVDRTEQVWSYRPDEAGSVTLKIASGVTFKTFALTVEESDIDVEPETNALALYLTSEGRSNAATDCDEWNYNNIEAELTGFNYVSNGWVDDGNGATVLRASGDARVSIPYKPFAADFRGTGKTIEIEFATRDIRDYDAVIMSCMSGGRGFQLTSQKATLKSEQSEISTQYKEDEHVRISFVAEKRSENRLLYIYINGIMSGVVQYPADDDFSQSDPVGISIGSSLCTIDVYNIRVYDNNLTRYQVLNNWIADTQDITQMLERYNHNNVYDEYGQVVIDKLPKDLPYFVLSAPELPQYKGDKKTITGRYVDPSNSANSFTFTGCQINVQGTSSAPYARKNYDMQFKNGFEMAGGHADNFALSENIVPFNRFVLKADVASSEGANNVELVKLYNDVTPYKRPEQEENAKVRQGIYGFPIVVFWNNTTNGETTLLGKYNFNLPKRAPGPYGYSGNMESWEFQNNTSDLMLFKSDYFDETPYTDPTTGDTKELWRYDYEARFPSDEWINYSKLQELQTFVVSTDRTKATGDALPEAVTYGETEYTNDTADYRLAKFKAEFGRYAEVSSFIFYYIFTELFLMVDSRAKNLFIGFSGSESQGLTAIDRKAVAEPYDMDTAIGTNNEGSLVFGYSLEDVDHLQSGANVFNGQESVLWNNIRDAFPAEIVAMYQTLRSAGVLSFANVEQRFEDHQAKWSEAIFNEDAIFKYILPLTSPDPGKTATAVYLPMLQGSKAEQRKWWLYNRFRYMDSKWNAGDALRDVIQLRGYAKDNVTVTPYADIYPTVKFGSYLVSERGQHGVPTTLVCPISTLNDTEIYIYSASQLAEIGDLSGLKVGFADLSMATRLTALKIGDADTEYSNGNLTELTLGNNTLLSSIDVRNCPNLVQAVDLSGCANIEHVYFGGTGITGCSLPNGGVLKTLELPGTITNLTIRNQMGITSFTMPTYENITTLRLENVSSVIDPLEILDEIPENSRVRLIGFTKAVASTAEVDAFVAKLDTMRGLDESGGNVDTAQVAGTITGLTNISGEWYASVKAKYPGLNIQYEHIASNLYYYNYDGSSLLNTEEILDGGNGTYSGRPSRAQTAQYTYTFAGWSREKNATSGDAEATKNVVADRSVYAAYTQTLRTYTVKFVKASADGGGTLQTLNNVAYGTTPSYTGTTPTSTQGEEYEFDGWTPAIGPITGNTTYTAVFADKSVEVVEIADSWDQIIANIDNGTYATKYTVGNYKPLDLGSLGVINMQIVGLNVDVLTAGGNAPITFIAMSLLGEKAPNKFKWDENDIRTYLSGTVYNAIPNNVKSHVVEVDKVSLAKSSEITTTDKVWAPSVREMNLEGVYETSGIEHYELFKNNDSRIKRNSSGTAKPYWLRTQDSYGKGIYVTSTGAYTSISTTYSTKNVCFGFCLG